MIEDVLVLSYFLWVLGSLSTVAKGPEQEDDHILHAESSF
jgi:hypothetical protein